MLKNRRYIIALTAGLISFLMLIIWIVILKSGDHSRAWYGFLINYLFFNSLAAGLTVWPAIIIASNGNWMGGTEKICMTGIAFAAPSIIALIALWIGSKSWAPWYPEFDGKEWWLNNNFLFIRNLAGQIIFWVIAYVFFKNRYKTKRKLYAGWLIFTYSIVFSLLGFDFVMSIEPRWHSMMMGGYFFISALYIASAAWALFSIIFNYRDKDILHDIGKILFSFCLLTTYTMYSQLMPIWYENLPDETINLTQRLNLEWEPVSYILLILIYLGPVLFLLTRRSKRNYKLLGIISAIILIGMWIERWQLVSAVFYKNTVLIGLPEIIPAIAFSAFLIGLFPYSMDNLHKITGYEELDIKKSK
jgi:hypothetical protein